MARFRPILSTASLLLLGLGLSAATSSQAADIPRNSLGNKDLCGPIIARAERRYGIPARLLRAISLAETGRVDPRSKAMLAWPWAVNAGGQGSYPASKELAIATVRRLRAQGARNIDVGCMQVNLMHHPKAFPNLRTAFDPERNVAYAAQFLKELHAKTGSWIDAVAAYHSRVSDHGTPYMLRVLKIWVDRRAPVQPKALAARTGRPGAIAAANAAKLAAKRKAAGASLARRATARSPEEVRRRWAEVVARRKRFAEWLAQRQLARQSSRPAGQGEAVGNPG